MSNSNPNNKILVTGATGYVGGRLVPRLLSDGYQVKAVGRSMDKLKGRPWASHPNLELARAAVHDQESIQKAMKDCTIAFYLIHSMNPEHKDFASSDRRAAGIFKEASGGSNLKRIIYLGGLGRYHLNLSSHLKSRLNVAEILIRSKVPCTILRAAIIIGSGSASYEIINNLVRNWPVYVVPAWTETLCQPISVRDVVKYLVGVLEIDETSGKSYEICGDDIISYKEMILVLARILKKRSMGVEKEAAQRMDERKNRITPKVKIFFLP